MLRLSTFGPLLVALAACGASSVYTDAAEPFDATDTPDASRPAVESLVSRELFEAIFLHRATEPCPGAFYTYDAFLEAAADFPEFANEGTDTERRREVAAFLANIAHETSGGWSTAPDGRYAWGLCFIREGGNRDVGENDAYCSPSETWPCEPGKKYYGRGPIQLSWNYNYGLAGSELGVPLLTEPERIEEDPVLAFRTALWFWMRPQGAKPSCHEVMTNAWTPSAADDEAGRKPGFGMTIIIINGTECGNPARRVAVESRLGHYARFAEILGVDEGDHVDCENMTHY